MIYNGKEASQTMQILLKERIANLGRAPVLAIISVDEHPSIVSFIRIKRKYAEALGVTIKEFNFKSETDESSLVDVVQALAKSNEYDGIIVQLPLPSSYDALRVLNAVPQELDVDVLSSDANASFIETGAPLPTVVGAVAHILEDTYTDIENKNVVIVGHGKLVGAPVAVWLKHQGITPEIIDADTDTETRKKLLQNADIVISGSGAPHTLSPEDFKPGVVIIDAGTSEQAGVLAGDCDPRCAAIANVFTPVPGGVGPLTVAYLFENVVSFAEKRRDGRWSVVDD
ncbi:MAG: bifunctional 5,10-methylenetetrahydrofolate dehydrogenase/5,10-methenyltetrahydrofolate cyclohydrolase [Candidatus Paceibacterota bacterium]